MQQPVQYFMKPQVNTEWNVELDKVIRSLLSPVLEHAFKELNWDEKSINIDGEYLNHLRFADDIVIITGNLGDAQQMLTELQITSANIGLNINFQKTND